MLLLVGENIAADTWKHCLARSVKAEHLYIITSSNFCFWNIPNISYMIIQICKRMLFTKQFAIYLLFCTELCSPQISVLKSLISNVNIFGNRTFKEIIKVKWDHTGSAI